MRKLLVFSCLLFSGIATASEQTGLIRSVMSVADGRTLVHMVESRTGKPACATFDYWFIADENSTAGKSQLSILLAAHASGRQVKIYGKGSCNRWTDGEDIDAVEML